MTNGAKVLVIKEREVPLINDHRGVGDEGHRSVGDEGHRVVVGAEGHRVVSGEGHRGVGDKRHIDVGGEGHRGVGREGHRGVVMKDTSQSCRHRLNMELDLQSSFGVHVTSCAQLFSLTETRNPPPPPFGLIYEGRYWSAKIDDISL